MKRKNSRRRVVPGVCFCLALMAALVATIGARPLSGEQEGVAQKQRAEAGSGSQGSDSHVQDEKDKRYAIIRGTVFDEREMSVFGVRVRIRRAEEKKARWEAFSDHFGEFAQRVPPGPADYVVWADVKNSTGSKPEKTVHVYGDELTTVFLHLDSSQIPRSKNP